MSEDINVLLKEVDVQKEQLSALRPLPEEALKKMQKRKMTTVFIWNGKSKNGRKKMPKTY